MLIAIFAVISVFLLLILNNTGYTNKNVTIYVGVIDDYFDYLMLPNGEIVREKNATY